MDSDETTLIDFRRDESAPDDQPQPTEPPQSAPANERPTVPWVPILILLGLGLLAGGLLLSTTPSA